MELWDKKKGFKLLETGKRLHDKVRKLGARVPVCKGL